MTVFLWMASKKIRHPEEVAKRPSRRTAGLDPARHPSLVPSPLPEKRGEQEAGGGGRGALAGGHLAFELGEPRGDPWRGAEGLEEAIADLGPQGGLRLRGAPPRPGAARFECGAEPRDI